MDLSKCRFCKHPLDRKRENPQHFSFCELWAEDMVRVLEIQLAQRDEQIAAMKADKERAGKAWKSLRVLKSMFVKAFYANAPKEVDELEAYFKDGGG